MLLGVGSHEDRQPAEHVESLVDQAGDDLVLRRRTGSLAGAAFLLLWLTIWTVGLRILLVVRLGQEPTFELAVFSIPFLVAWLVGFACLLTAFLGFERLRVGSDGLEHRTLTGRRLVPLAEVKGIAHCRRIIKRRGPASGPSMA